MTPRTLLDNLASALRNRAASPDSRVPPVAILWPDPGREWVPVTPALRRVLPELLILGDYDPGNGTGPAIWLRCIVDRTLTGPKIPDDRPPVLYMPGVERSRLRAGDGCPAEVRPLVELMYRGVLWHQPNGRDWTPTAFLRSRAGGGLDIANDKATRQALLNALHEVMRRQPGELKNGRLDADDFDEMLVDDLPRSLLRWIGDRNATKAGMDKNEWSAFCTRCRNGLGFDPERQMDIDAARRLVKGSGRWAKVWRRFSDAPEHYKDVVDVLARSRPAGVLPFNRERWPDLNDQDEEAARQALKKAAKLALREACDTVAKLEKTHAPRRDWLWARLGRSPIATVLEHLAKLAKIAESPVGGTSLDETAAAYTGNAWVADASAREALAVVTRQDEALVAGVVRHLLEVWMDESARALQTVAADKPFPAAGDQPLITANDNECIVFVDGLRYELGRALAVRLEERGCVVSVGHRWAALPTVTASAKPAVTPVAEQVGGGTLGPEFRPPVTLADRPLPADAARLREGMEQRGYQILGLGTLDLPLDAPGRGWLETGEVDKLGHNQGNAARFAQRLNEELERIAGRIVELLESGWDSVRVVTDHGWLWLPGGLPMVTLPKHLTTAKWGRCAVVSGESEPDALLFPWHWNRSEWFASPRGVACFSKRNEYSHGGVSVQECLIPDMRIHRANTVAGATATIRSTEWRGLRLVAQIDARGGPHTADLRLGHAGGESVVHAVKEVQDDGHVSLVLAGDEHEDAALVFVVIGDGGRILANQPTRAGGSR